MNFRIATDKDFKFMQEHSTDKDFYKECPEQVEYDFVLEHNDDILGVGGFKMINNTTAWCYFDLSDKVENHLIVCYRVIKEFTDIFCKEHGIFRLEAYVKVGFEAGMRTVEHLGFSYEHRMLKFIGQAPADLYVKFYNGDK